MSINLKKKYYSMPREAFNQYLSEVKTDSRSINFFGGKNEEYFFLLDDECIQCLLELHRQQIRFDGLIDSIGEKKREFVIESLIIDEIKTTNATENIYSTRKNIFGLMNQVSSIKDKKVKSILQAYQTIMDPKIQITDSSSVRAIYDVMMKGAFDCADDRPDGNIFRKGSVEISDGFKSVHKGFYPESEILKGMEEFLRVYKNQGIDLYERLILSHFLIETIHPFYDGNGRLGRLLFSKELLNEGKTLSAYLVSSSINQKKKMYYSALEEAREYHGFGCLNEYFIQMAEILSEGLKDAYSKLEASEQQCRGLIEESRKRKMTKSQHKIMEYLIEASCFTYYGTTNDKIIENCDVSKRTVISAIEMFRENNMLDDTKIGAFDYHKIKNATILMDEEVKGDKK